MPHMHDPAKPIAESLCWQAVGDKELSVGRLDLADLAIPTEVFTTGWNTALRRPPAIEIADPSCLGFGPVKVASLPIRPPSIPVFSCVFPESPVPAMPVSSPSKEGRPKPDARPQSLTRLRPPSDVVKLQDRLYYLLQPPLEHIVTAGHIEFPFSPFPYQFEGIAFLYSRFSAVLADEMGLGKTMQAISTIRLLLHSGEIRSVLLICPKPLVTNWQREFSLWAPELPVTVVEGDPAKRRFAWQQPMPIKIVNYEAAMREREMFENEEVQFDLVVLDEAQRIKNRRSTTSEVVCSVPRRRSWALTGTPVENSPEDLVGIFEFLQPGFLRPEMGVRDLASAVSDHVLRRTKDMVLNDLPPKMYRDAELDLTSEQWESYLRAEDEGVIRLQEMDDALTIQHVFELVLRLKQICNFDPLTKASAKLERLRADMEEVAASGKKAIVFSQWVHTLEAMADQLAEFHPLQYHGRIPSRKRDGVIEEFRNGADRHVLLMSYGAGSVGLNLQFCEYVFLFDRWWNPAVEDQAINRAHRIGAAGPVTVTRMLMLQTIEERINQVLEEKRQLFDSIFNTTAEPAKVGLTQDDIFGLFNLRTPQGPIKKSA